jgi:hypothetical protein
VQPLGEILICDVFNATSTSNGGGGGGGATTGSIVVIKQVVGGNATSSDFSIHVKNATSSVASTSLDIAGSPQAGSTSGNIYMTVATGTYMISETGGPASYSSSFSGACDANGDLIVTAGATSTCTIVNTFASSGGGGGGGRGGGSSGSSGSSGGGGGNGPISTFVPQNGPVFGNALIPSGQVLGNSINLPETSGVGGYVPGVPNTGEGGNAGATLVLLGALLAIISLGLALTRRRTE